MNKYRSVIFPLVVGLVLTGVARAQSDPTLRFASQQPDLIVSLGAVPGGIGVFLPLVDESSAARGPFVYALARNKSSIDHRIIDLPPGIAYGAIPDGRISLDGRAREVGSTLMYYRATDREGGFVEQQFILTVTDGGIQPAPLVLAPASVPAKTYTARIAIDTLTLPTASGGIQVYTYTLSGAPEGTVFDGGNDVVDPPVPPTLSGAPAAGSAGDYSLAFTVTDSQTPAATASLTFIVTVNPHPPIFTPPSLSEQFYTATEDIGTLTLPTVSAGTGTYTFTLFGAPTGLVFAGNTNPATLSGMPASGSAGDYSLTFTAADSAGKSTSLIFGISVNPEPVVLTPDAPDDQTFIAGRAVDFDGWPSASSGTMPYAFTLNGDAGLSFNGLVFDGTTDPPTLRGTPLTAMAAAPFTFAVSDSSNPQRSASLIFNIEFGESLGFAADARTGYTFAISTNLNVRLPQGMGGVGALTYALTRAGGISNWMRFDPDTRVLSGTVVSSARNRGINYRVTDANGFSATLILNFITRARPDFNTTHVNRFQGTTFEFHTGETVELSLPRSNFGVPPYAYALRPATGTGLTSLPAWMRFDTSTGVLSVTPLTGIIPGDTGAGPYIYTAADVNGATDNNPSRISFHVRVFELRFTGQQPDLTFPVRQRITQNVLLPEFDAGSAPTGDFVYRMARNRINATATRVVIDLPAGIAYSGNSFAGRPLEVGRTVMYYRAINRDDNRFAEQRFIMAFTDGSEFAALSLNSASVPAQTYTARTDIGTLTLPIASGGTQIYTYTLSGAPDGLVFDGGQDFTRETLVPPTLSGAPAADSARPSDGMYSLTFTATDAVGAAISLVFAATVNSSALVLDPASVDEQTYIVAAITTMTLPAAGNGLEPYTFTLNGELNGLVFDGGTNPPTLSGIPSVIAATTSLTFAVTDSQTPAATASLTFRVTANPLTPFFTPDSLSEQSYTATTGIGTLTLPSVAGGVGGYTFTLDGTPSGLVFAGNTNPATLSGTPAADSAGDYSLTFTATDAAGVSAGLTFAATVDPSVLVLSPASVAEQTYIAGAAITTLTLPAVGNGIAPYTFTLDGELNGLVLDGATNPPTLSGTPTVIAAATSLTFAVTDSQTPAATASLTFSVTAKSRTPVFTPPSLNKRSYAAAADIGTLTLPTVSAATGAYTFTLFGAPSGLVFAGNTNPATLSGMPVSGSAGDYSLTFIATDAVGVSAGLTFALTVNPSVLVLDPASVAQQIYIAGAAITTLTLPAVSNGIAPYTFTLNGELNDLEFDGGTNPPTLSGTPSVIAAATSLTLVVTDSQTPAATASLTFSVTVNSRTLVFTPPSLSEQSYTFAADIGTLTLPTVSAGTGAYTFTLFGAPSGLVFAGNTNPATLGGVPVFGSDGTHSLTFTATDSAGGSVSLTFNINVNLDPPVLTPDTLDDQTFIIGHAVNFDGWPSASGTIMPYAFALNGDAGLRFNGLTFDGATDPPTLRGTPLTAMAAAPFTFTVSDSSEPQRSTNLTFNIEFGEPLGFADDARTGYTYAVSTNVNVRLPQATGGVGALTYALTRAGGIPNWMHFDPDTQVLSGTAILFTFDRDFNYRVTDANGVSAMLILDIKTRARPDFDATHVDRFQDTTFEFYTGETVELSLPRPNFGVPPHTYALRPATGAGLTGLPAWMRFDTSTGVLSVTPLTGTMPGDAEEGPYIYTAADVNGATGANPSEISFYVRALELRFAGQQPDITFPVGQLISSELMLPVVDAASAARGSFVYRLARNRINTASSSIVDLPEGMVFGAQPDGRILLGGTPGEAGRTLMYYRAINTDDNRFVEQQFILAISPFIPLAVTPTAVAAKLYTAGAIIDTLALPTASGGTQIYTYTLSGAPDGLVFDGGQDFAGATLVPPTLSGTPAADSAGDYSLTFTATDAAGAGTSLTFGVSVLAAGICNRTPQVVAGLLERLGVDADDCDKVNTTQLATITSLDLMDKSISALREGDFTGLSALRELLLRDNDLTGLPAGLFDGLNSLSLLWLSGNNLSALPTGLLTNLLDTLSFFAGHPFFPLKATIGVAEETEPNIGEGLNHVVRFDITPALAPFAVSVPYAVSLGGGASAADFDTASAGCTAPEDGFFIIAAGQSSAELTFCTVSDGEVEPIETMDLVLGTDALPATGTGVRAASSLLGGSLATLDIDPARNSATFSIHDGDLFTFSQNSLGDFTYTTSARIVRTLPTVNSGGSEVSYTLQGDLNNGLELFGAVRPPLLYGLPLAAAAKTSLTFTATGIAGLSASLTFTVTVEGICERTGTVRASILGALGRVGNCISVNAAQLATITGLELSGKSINNLRGRDFSGLSSLQSLKLNENNFTTLPEGVFAGLGSLQLLELNENNLTRLSESVFADLSSLQSLELNENSLASLPENVFAGLGLLQRLELNENQVVALPAGIFATLDSLHTLELENNRLKRLSAGLLNPLLDTLTSFSGDPFFPLEVTYSVTRESDQGVSEGQAQAFRFDLTPALALFAVSVPYAISFGGGASAEDFDTTTAGCTALEDGFITIAAGRSSAELTFCTAVDEHIREVGETLRLTLGAGIRPVTDAGVRVNADLPVPSLVILQLDTAQSSADLPVIDALIFDPKSVGDPTFTANTTIDTLTLPVVTDDTVPYTYMLDGAPGGLSFNGDAIPPTLSGTLPIESAGDYHLTFTVTDAARVRAELVFRITVSPASLEFTPAAMDDQTYAVTTDIGTLTLSAARGGVYPHIFTLGGAPDGLSFDGGAIPPTLSGAPANNTEGVYSLTFTVNDSAVPPVTADLIFGVVVNEIRGGICGRTPQVEVRLLEKLSADAEDCATVSNAELGVIFDLIVSNAFTFPKSVIGTLREGDFAGLGALRRLFLQDAELTSLPEDVFAGLGMLEVLDLSRNDLTVLPEGVFAGLGALIKLDLNENNLAALPEAVFAGLGALETLALGDNDLTTLPEAVFAGLGMLRGLGLSRNDLTTLPEAVFAGLGALRTLGLSGNDLTTLAGAVFTGLSALDRVDLSDNKLNDLPAEVFVGLDSLQRLSLDGNELSTLPTGLLTPVLDTLVAFRGNPHFPLEVAISVVGEADRSISEGQDHVIRFELSPALAPFAISVPYAITLGGGASAVDFDSATAGCAAPEDGFLTIAAGQSSVELTFCTVTDDETESVELLSLIPGSDARPLNNAGVRIDDVPLISSLMTLSIDPAHNSAALSVQDELTGGVLTFSPAMVEGRVYTTGTEVLLTLPTASGGVGELSYVLQGHSNGLEFDEAARPPVLSGTPLTAAATTSLIFSVTDSTGARASLVFTVTVNGICERTEAVRAGILDVLNGVDDCAAVSAADLAVITRLDLSSISSIGPLREGDFAGLGALQQLRMIEAGLNNNLTTLPVGVFAGLDSLETLNLGDNDLETLPAGVFAGLDSLVSLNLHGNDLTTLPETVFAGLSALQGLNLIDNGLTTLPEGVFAGLDSLGSLDLWGNELTVLPAGVFAGLGSLGTLNLGSNDLTTLPEGMFAGLDSLRFLRLQANEWSTLPAGLLTPVLDTLSLFEGVPYFPLEATYSVTGEADQDISEGQNYVIRFDLTPALAPFAISVPYAITLSGGASAADFDIATAGCTAPEDGFLDIAAGQSSAELTFCTATDDNMESVEILSLIPGADARPLNNAGVRIDDVRLISSLVTLSIDSVHNSAAFSVHDESAVNVLTFSPVIVEDQFYTTGTEVLLTLPTASGGVGELSYALQGHSNGLEFDGMARPPVLSGTPLTVAATKGLVFSVIDSTGARASLAFHVTVNGICERTEAVRVGILNALSGVDDCTMVGAAQLAAITRLDLGEKSISALREDDFAGLDSLRNLLLNDNELNTLPTGVFAGLDSLQTLSLLGNRLGTLPISVLTPVLDTLTGFSGTSPFLLNSTIGVAGETDQGIREGQDHVIRFELTRVLAPFTISVPYAIALDNGAGAADFDDTTAGCAASEDGSIVIASGRTSAELTFCAAADDEKGETGETLRLTPGTGPPPVGDAVVFATASSSVTLLVSLPLDVARSSVNLPIIDLVVFTPDSVGDQTYTAGAEIDALELPIASGGAPPYTFTLDGAPDGLSFNGDALSGASALSGTPADSTEGNYSLTFTVGDSAASGMSASITFGVTVIPPPMFERSSVDEQTYTTDTEINTLTLPAVSGGTEPYTFTLDGAPAGLSFDNSTNPPTLGGAPATSAAGDYRLTFTVTDAARVRAGLTFGVNVKLAVPLGFTPATVDDQTYKTNTDIGTLTLPIASGGTEPYTFTLDGVPAGLSFDGDATSPTLSGTPATNAAGDHRLTFSVTDAARTRAGLTFRVTVNLPDPLVFTPATVDDQTYTVATDIGTLTLPTARGGTEPYTFTLGGAPGGLSFDGDAISPTLSGAPADNTEGAYSLTFSVTDAVRVRADLNFRVTVSLAVPLALTPTTVGDQSYTVTTDIGTLTLPTVRGGVLPHTFTLDGAPDGLFFDGDATPPTLSGAPADNTEGAYSLTFTVSDSVSPPAIAGLTFGVVVKEIRGGVCGRTTQVERALLGVLGANASDCPTVGASQLAGITHLDLSGPGLRKLKASDLAGLGGLNFLDLSENNMQGLPEEIFAGLENLERLDLSGSEELTIVPRRIFIDLGSLKHLDLSGGGITKDDAANEADVPGLPLLPAPVLDDLTFFNGMPRFPLRVEVSVSGVAGKDEEVTIEVAEQVNNGVEVKGVAAFATEVSYTVTITPPPLEFDNPPAGANCRAPENGVITVPAGQQEVTIDFCVVATEDVDLSEYTFTLDLANIEIATAAAAAARALRGNIYSAAGLGNPAVAAALLTHVSDPAKRTSAVFEPRRTDSNKTRITALNKALLPEISRAIADANSSAITERIRQVATDWDAAATYNLGGHQDLETFAAAQMRTLAEGDLDFKELLTRSAFSVPLRVAPVQAGAADFSDVTAAGASSEDTRHLDTAQGVSYRGINALAFWASGTHRSFNGAALEDVGVKDWDGDLYGAHIGADILLRPGALAGFALSLSESDIDYVRNNAAGAGNYTLEMLMFSPYLSWRTRDGGFDLWAVAGFGEGELSIREDKGINETTIAEMRNIAFGGELMQTHHDINLRLKTEAIYTVLKIYKADEIEGLEVDAARMRVALESSRARTGDNGSRFEPSAEIGIRHDIGGDNLGPALELRVNVRHTGAGTGLSTGGGVYAIFGNDYNEWGIEGAIAFTPQTKRGLSFSLSPRYGTTHTKVEQIWRQDFLPNDSNNDRAPTLDARLSYAIPRGRLKLTPYIEFNLGDGKHHWHTALNWRLRDLFDFTLSGERRESDEEDADHTVLLKGRLNF